ncbi:hypothetical protein ACS0TY_021228 [Phlomoides rotata]
MRNMNDLVMVSDDECKDQLRMDRSSFHKLCGLVKTIGGLKSSRNISVEEKVAMFLSILAHHTKNRCVKFRFKRSGQTVSKHFHHVLNYILRLQYLFLVTPQPVDETISDTRWGKFQGCLGALDGTYIDVHVPVTDKGQYRNRKGHCSVNVLGLCDMNMRFIYVLTGWEGSAADSRVLRDAIHWNNGLHVPRGNYYLCDNGYPNREVFFDTVQRCEISLDPSWYPIKTANKIIVACYLLHNYIRREMDVDPLEGSLDEYISTQSDEELVDEVEVIESLETTIEWNTWRDTVAHNMFNEWNLTI